MARIITGPAWVDTATQRFVISWYNRRRIAGLNALSSNFTTSSTTNVEGMPSNRAEFLCWADDTSVCIVQTYNFNATFYCLSTASFDGTTNSYPLATFGNNGYPCTIVEEAQLADGYHYGTLLCAVSAGAGTGTWQGATTVSQTNVTIETRG